MAHEDDERSDEEDIEELRQVLSVVAEFLDKLPAILKQIFDVVYSKDTGERVGESVAGFYNKLVQAGMPKDVVLKMTEEFFERSMVLDRLISQALSGGMEKLSEGAEIEEEIRERIKGRAEPEGRREEEGEN